MIENVQSPLCLKLLKVSSSKTRLFIKPTGNQNLYGSRELWHYRPCPFAGRAPSQHPLFSDLSFLLLLLGWLDSFSLNALLSPPPEVGITTMILMPLYPSLACVHLPDSQIQRGLSKAQINSKEMYHFSYGLYTALPFLFRHQLFESRLQFQCNKITNWTFVFLSSDWFLKPLTESRREGWEILWSPSLSQGWQGTD